jgi:Mor family transcriptional regulator
MNSKETVFVECLQQELERAIAQVGRRWDAVEIARITVNAVRQRCASDRIYIAETTRSERRERHARIAAEYTGSNGAEIIERYGLSSRRRLREIVARQRIEAAGARAGSAYNRLLSDNE